MPAVRSSSALETGKLLKSFHVFQAAAEVGDKRGATDTFFAEESVSWTSLGVSDRLSRALNNVGLGRPSLVQVFDETDMLLCGSFQNQAIRLINLFRFDEKLLSRATKAVVEKPEDPCSDSLMASEFQDDKDLPTELNLPEEEGAEDETVLEELTEGIDVKCTKRKDWRRELTLTLESLLPKKFQLRSVFSYSFVLNFLPICLAFLKQVKVRKDNLHQKLHLKLNLHSELGKAIKLEQMWIEVTVDTQVDVLIDSVKQGFRSKEFDSAAGLSRTMVFANTVEAVETVSKILASSGNECFRYHSYTSLEERTQILVDFQQKGGILVCTDAAACGLDVMNVSHVIQAEFARSAVDFLHRVGRTARAGQPGLVTSLYSDSNQDLVDAVRQAGTLDLPVENAFSRKRSFRKKIKKRGRSEVGETLSAGDRVLA
ncbi:hypothetical protein RHMOL_Rhmol13G0008300 [Rhododendron molle]|uniref:Uncharacterized protein n=1 Tax=Rhododendron molle TaxID=49168 RepID=A0ACC0L1P7_RHOML|nr:hypothetical protein RHMOL_Rhmol13G0008300 [Rhododendron molle]